MRTNALVRTHTPCAIDIFLWGAMNFYNINILHLFLSPFLSLSSSSSLYSLSLSLLVFLHVFFPHFFACCPSWFPLLSISPTLSHPQPVGISLHHSRVSSRACHVTFVISSTFPLSLHHPFPPSIPRTWLAFALSILASEVSANLLHHPCPRLKSEKWRQPQHRDGGKSNRDRYDATVRHPDSVSSCLFSASHRPIRRSRD